MIVETEIKHLRLEFKKDMQDLRKLIVGKMLGTTWVQQPYACALVNVKPRRLRDIRIHLDKDSKVVGCIKWKKGKGRAVLYYKPDLEKYIGEHQFNS